ncbi:hypothetical protein ACQU0X_25910 [Pseudovibrio ascidiaceicola]|uniref:hypothetical protein n=1 Tax=Pseudovibrio ascidiaceicola TaxID=285279 RepID=UPI003D35FBEE
MKFIWEPEDIRAGRRVWTTTTETGACFIAYDPDVSGGQHYALVALCDGVFFRKNQTAQAMADAFNESGVLPDAVLSPPAECIEYAKSSNELQKTERRSCP